MRAPVLKKIWDLFQSRIGKTTIRTKCADAMVREFSSWNQFSSFDNPPQKKISQLIISSRSEDMKKSASIDFSDWSWRSIGININGNEQVVSRLYDEVADILESTRPWYSRITKFNFFYAISFPVLFSIIVMLLYNLDKTKGVEQSVNIGRAILITAVSISIFTILALIIWGLNKLRSKYFPFAYFALGQGEERYKVDEKIRWCILVGFVVSFTASIFVAVILRN